MRVFISIAFILLLPACGGSGTAKRLETLDDAVNNYAQAMRWGRYEDAEVYHMARDGQRLKFNLDDLENIRITGYTVRDRELNKDMMGADVTGEYSYFSTSYGALRHVQFQQKWWYEEKSKRWFVEGGLPDFK